MRKNIPKCISADSMTLRFVRALQCRVKATGPAYRLAIPREIAAELGLSDGGICSLEIRGSEVVLQAYADTLQPYRKRWKPPERAGELGFYDVPLPPRTRGRSGPWPTGEVLGSFVLQDLRAAHRYCEQQFKLIRPSRRGRKSKRRCNRI